MTEANVAKVASAKNAAKGNSPGKDVGDKLNGSKGDSKDFVSLSPGKMAETLKGGALTKKKESYQSAQESHKESLLEPSYLGAKSIE